jgi:hypothetical protein
MASRVFGRQEGQICGTLEVELHRKVLRLSGLGFLAYRSGRLSGGQSVLRPFAIVPATPFTLLEVQQDPMWMGYVGRNSETEPVSILGKNKG